MSDCDFLDCYLFSINYFFIDKPNMVRRFYWDALYIETALKTVTKKMETTKRITARTTTTIFYLLTIVWLKTYLNKGLFSLSR